jgi:hypothetical protein
MLWSEIRSAYPNQWLIIEALEAFTTPDNKRRLNRLAVIEQCPDGKEAFQRYRSLHRVHPHREYYFVHTSNLEFEIRELQWAGIRRDHVNFS